MSIWSRIVNVFRGDRLNREIDEELQAFMDASLEDKMRRGMSREAALRTTMVEAGHAELVQHKVWSAGWEAKAESFWRDLIYTFRRLFPVARTFGASSARNCRLPRAGGGG